MHRVPDARVERPRRAVIVDHPKTGERFRVRRDGETLAFDRPDASFPARIARWAIGSGAHTRSFLHVEAGGLFELPLTWYRGRGWDLSPGYQIAEHPGFLRAIGSDCVACHSDPLPPIPGRPGWFTGEPVGAIGCGRCHGDARAHASNAGDAPVVMPDRLPPDRRADVCAQCHLAGEVRIGRAQGPDALGRAAAAFRPGDRLADHVAVFVRQDAGGGFGIASHAERLGRSACATRSPDLTCTTCHHPHPTGGVPPPEAACRSCHDTAKNPGCGAGHGDDCVGCHMHRGGTRDVPHVRMTDHFIRVRPEPAPRAPVTAVAPLVWVAQPDTDPTDPEHRRLLARAYTEAFRAHGYAADRDRALPLLGEATQRFPDDPELWRDLATIQSAFGRTREAAAAAERALTLRPGDPRFARAAATFRRTSGQPARALAALAAALAEHPDDAALNTAAAEARLAEARLPEAVQRANHALSRHPDHAPALMVHGVAATMQRDAAAAARAFEHAAAAEPSSVRAWSNLVRARLGAGEAKAALEAADHALQITSEGHPERFRLDGHWARAAWALGRREAAEARARGAVASGPSAEGGLVLAAAARARGDLAGALTHLDAALKAAPWFGPLWSELAATLEGTGDPATAEQARAQAARLGSW